MTVPQVLTCRAIDGIELPALYWPSDSMRGMICILHGLGEHIGRYQGFAERANAAGLGVFGADFRGHGRAPGEACFVKTFDEYSWDATAMLVAARGLAQGTPLFLMGHSMGGAIALRVMTVRSEWRGAIAGLISSSAALKIGREVSPLLLKLAPLVARLAPRLRLQPLDPAVMSRDPKEVEAYRTDPLICHQAAPARTANELLKVIVTNRYVMPKLTMPLYVLHGDADVLTDVDGSRELHAAWGGEDKTLRIWPGSYHEVLHDLDGAAVSAELIDWISARCPRE
jgi:acylglycerol lipase